MQSALYCRFIHKCSFVSHLARRSAWLSGDMVLEVGAAACGISTTRDVVHVPSRLMLAADGAVICMCKYAYLLH